MDCLFLGLALYNLRAATLAVARMPISRSDKEQLQAAKLTFDKNVSPKVLRNVLAAHIDDYLRGDGNLHKSDRRTPNPVIESTANLEGTGPARLIVSTVDGWLPWAEASDDNYTLHIALGAGIPPVVLDVRTAAQAAMDLASVALQIVNGLPPGAPQAVGRFSVEPTQPGGTRS